MINPRFAKALIVAPVLLALLAAAGRAEIIEQILVRVNGELFTKTDLETRQIAALREMGQRLDPTTANLDDAQLRKMLDQVTPELMVGVIDEMLLVQRGKELGYVWATNSSPASSTTSRKRTRSRTTSSSRRRSSRRA